MTTTEIAKATRTLERILKAMAAVDNVDRRYLLQRLSANYCFECGKEKRPVNLCDCDPE